MKNKPKKEAIQVTLQQAYVIKFRGEIYGIELTKEGARARAKMFQYRMPLNTPVEFIPPSKTSKKKQYALFSNSVSAKEKHNLTKPPTKFFPSRDAAHKWAKKQGWKKGEYKVMTY